MFQSGGSVPRGTAPQACTCVPGYYCPAGSRNPTGRQCPLGSFCTGGTANAIECPAGTFCPLGAPAKTDCTCAGGYYCPAGSTTSVGIVCPAGSYCSGKNANSLLCNNSPYYCPQGSISNSATNCIRTVSTLTIYPPNGTGSGNKLAIWGGVLYITTTSNSILQTGTEGGSAPIIAGGESGSPIDGNAVGYQSDYGYVGAILSSPRAICIGASGTIYFTDDDLLRKIVNYNVITITTSGLSGASGIAVDSNETLYIADTGNNRILKATSSGTLSLLAGSGVAGTADGTGAAAQFYQPQGIAVDSAGNVYVADTENHRIRKITPAGVVTTIAGSTAGYSDGYGTLTQFNTPVAIAVDSLGSLYIADSANNRVRKMYLDTCDKQMYASNDKCYSCVAGSSRDPYCSEANQTIINTTIPNTPAITITLGIVGKEITVTSGVTNGLYTSVSISPFPAPSGYSYTSTLSGGTTSANTAINTPTFNLQAINFSPTNRPTHATLKFYLNSSGGNIEIGTATLMIASSWPSTYSPPRVWNVTTFAGTGAAGGSNGIVRSSALNKSQESIVPYSSAATFYDVNSIVVDSSFTVYILDRGEIRKITQPQSCDSATGL